MRNLFLLFFLLLTRAATAQPPAGDTAEINRLITQANAQLFKHTSNALTLLNQAYTASKTLNYLPGMAAAQYSNARLQGELGNFTVAEGNATEAYHLYTQLGLSMKAVYALNTTMFSLYAQSRFHEADSVYNMLAVLCARIPGPEAAKMFASATSMLGCMYQEAGNYGKAFSLCYKGLQSSIAANDSIGMIYGTVVFGVLYSTIGDEETAMYYFKDVEQKRKKYHITEKAPYTYMGHVFYKKGQYDSAAWYYQQQLNAIDTMRVDAVLKKRYAMFPQVDIAQILIQQQQYPQAMDKLLEAYHFFTHGHDNNQVLRTLNLLGQACLAVHQVTAALHYARSSLSLAQQTGSQQYQRDANALLWRIYDSEHHTDSAYQYLVRFTALNDSIDLDQSTRKLAFYKTTEQNQRSEARIALLENQRKAGMQRINMLLGGIFGLIIIGIVLLHNLNLKRKNEHIRRQQLENELQLQKTESERRQAEFERHTADLKMQALRAQMNPHFIFNCLNSINCFILQNETETAADYLTKFARLIRLVLQNGDKTEISLAEELEMLNIYLKLEQVRFSDRFNYRIQCDEDVQADNVQTPPMLIQPFVENAIWHGLLHKNEKGLVTIHVYTGYGYLCCRITDDGIGRQKAATLKSKSANHQKSFGMRLTSERLSLLQQQKKQKISLQVTDLTDASGEACGTEILIQLPLHTQPTLHTTSTNHLI